MNIELKWELRLCKVGDTVGYFHTWEQGNSKTYGLVEFPNGRIQRIEPINIKFIDENHEMLIDISKRYKERKENKL